MSILQCPRVTGLSICGQEKRKKRVWTLGKITGRQLGNLFGIQSSANKRNRLQAASSV